MNRRIIALALILLLCLSLIPVYSHAAAPAEAERFPVEISIDGGNFPDDAFLEVVSGLDTDRSGGLSRAEIAAVTALDCSGRGIGSLDGLGHFTALTALYCADNALTDLRLRRCDELLILDCGGNAMDSLDLSGYPLLSSLYRGGSAAESGGSVSYRAGERLLTVDKTVSITTPAALALPAALAALEEEALSGTGAQMIIVPAGVETIEAGAFADCPHLRVLFFEGSPADIDPDALVVGGVTVYAPRGSSAGGWAADRNLPVVYYGGAGNAQGPQN